MRSVLKNSFFSDSLAKRLPVFFLICFLTMVSANGAKSRVPPRPDPPKLVNNLSAEFPDFFSAEETLRLERKLRTFSDSTSNQIAVVVVDDLNGMEAWAFATEIIHVWGIGQEKLDNGVVILIKPTGGAGNRDIHIAVGYGLEGVIPDLTARRIVENELLPGFSTGRFFEAVDNATNVLMALAKGEYDYQSYGKKKGKGKLSLLLIIIIVIFIVIIFFGKGGDGMTIGPKGTMFWPPVHRNRGGWGGFGGGSGGFGGGGWGGFGGGSAGGGGAGGKW